MLDQVKRTSAGLGNLPHWYLQLGAPSLLLPLSHLCSLSLQQSIVSTQWKSSVITPVPNDPRKFSNLAVSKILGVASFLPDLTIIGAQRGNEPKKANKSIFNTGLSAGNYLTN